MAIECLYGIRDESVNDRQKVEYAAKVKLPRAVPPIEKLTAKLSVRDTARSTKPRISKKNKLYLTT